MMNPSAIGAYPGMYGAPVMPTQPVMPTSMPAPNPNPYSVSAFMPQNNPAPAAPEMDWIRVPSFDNIKDVYVQPNGKAWIMLQNEPIFAVKTADAMGLASTQAFRFEPYNPETRKTDQEFAPLDIVMQMQTQIQLLSSELDALKGGTQNGKPVKQSVSTAEPGAQR